MGQSNRYGLLRHHVTVHLDSVEWINLQIRGVYDPQNKVAPYLGITLEPALSFHFYVSLLYYIGTHGGVEYVLEGEAAILMEKHIEEAVKIGVGLRALLTIQQNQPLKNGAIERNCISRTV